MASARRAGALVAVCVLAGGVGFVQALSGEAAWTHWPCPWLNADCNGDGNVTFDDIDVFVARIGAVCP